MTNLRSAAATWSLAVLLYAVPGELPAEEAQDFSRVPQRTIQIVVDEEKQVAVVAEGTVLPDQLRILGAGVRAGGIGAGEGEGSEPDALVPLPVTVTSTERFAALRDAVQARTPSVPAVELTQESGASPLGTRFSACPAYVEVYFGSGHVLEVSCLRTPPSLPSYEWVITPHLILPAGWPGDYAIWTAGSDGIYQRVASATCSAHDYTFDCYAGVSITRPDRLWARVTAKSTIQYSCPELDPFPCVERYSYVVELGL